MSQLSTGNNSAMGDSTEQAASRGHGITAGDDSSLAVGPSGNGARWRRWLGARLDGAGMVWSAFCALHCAVPLALSAAALVAGTTHEHGHDHDHGNGSLVELALVITSVAVAGVVLVRGYARKHRDWRPLGLFTVSVAALVVSGVTTWRSETAGMSMTAAGFAGLVAAQLVNMALVRRRHPCCEETRC